MRNGTESHHGDLPAFLLRMALGPMLVAHGYNKVLGSGGLEGTTKWFDSLGLKPAWVHARLAAATEITAGSLITIGAFNPAPAAAVIGLMATAAATDHRGKGFFVFKGGWEYTAVVAVAAAAMGALGYGRFSVDHLRGRHRMGLRWALIAAAIGVGNSRALLAASFKPDQPA